MPLVKDNHPKQLSCVLCPALIVSIPLLTNTKYIFDDSNIDEQGFIASIMMENLKCKNKLDNI